MQPSNVPPSDLIASLRAAKVVSTDKVRVQPLRGGVSSDIVLVQDGTRRFVVKRALAKLRVADDWFADIARNRVEQAYFEYASRIVPDAVPRVLAGDASEGWFAMEYLGEGFSDWKQQLLGGQAAPIHAQRAGDILGKLHAASWGDPVARKQFSTLANFHALRIEPYLLTTASRVPAARDFLTGEAERLAGTCLALVHGDYSPKNLLVSPERLVVLDAEVAWYGDPAFDTAFLLNHLHLKALVHYADAGPFLALIPAFWGAYIAALGSQFTPGLERTTVRLLLGLMLARIHGKSPAEYLSREDGEYITQFTLRHMLLPPSTLAEFTAAWSAALERA